MIGISDSSVAIQVSLQFVPSTPAWFGEMALTLSLSQAVVRLDGQYGNGAIVADLAGLSYVMRGSE